MPASGAIGSLSLADFTTESLIIPQLSKSKNADVIHELSQLLQKEDRVPELLPFYDAVMSRELLVSTSMDNGIAFPHGRLDGLKRVSFALGRSAEPIAWGPNGTAQVKLIFLIAAPATGATNYLSLISGLARLGKEIELLEKLHSVERSTQMFSALKEVKIRNA